MYGPTVGHLPTIMVPIRERRRGCRHPMRGLIQLHARCGILDPILVAGPEASACHPDIGIADDNPRSVFWCRFNEPPHRSKNLRHFLYLYPVWPRLTKAIALPWARFALASFAVFPSETLSFWWRPIWAQRHSLLKIIVRGTTVANAPTDRNELARITDAPCTLSDSKSSRAFPAR